MLRLTKLFAITLTASSASLPARAQTNNPPKPSTRSVLDLNPWKQISELKLGGKPAVTVRLLDLNPNHHVWYLLGFSWPGTKRLEFFHLENRSPGIVQVLLDKTFDSGLTLVSSGKRTPCPLWTEGNLNELIAARSSKKTFVPICGGNLYLRNQAEGKETTKEWAADFLRKHVPGGEQITSLVKDYLYQDKFQIIPEVSAQGPTSIGSNQDVNVGAPTRARVAPDYLDKGMKPEQVGLDLGEWRDKPMIVGQWYPIANQKGIFFSTIEAKMVSPDILTSHLDRVRKLDSVEDHSAVYSVAFDLSQHRVGFMMGSDHPSAEWSERTREDLRDRSMPGPDGFADYQPLTMTGKLNPDEAKRVVATFTGGFKRSHSAFKWGELSMNNRGSHYGFAENGVLLSTLQPKLATIMIDKNFELNMKTWTAQDNLKVDEILHARQNGVPIIDYDEAKKQPVPGSMVGSWNMGNWSGSQESKQRALRAGICLQETQQRRFLIYSYFSSVTPNAMARVFQAYDCKYAMHLDMNALEHTYLAIYRRIQDAFDITHLITGMNVLDKKVGTSWVPRFVGTADNRDFFYLMAK